MHSLFSDLFKLICMHVSTVHLLGQAAESQEMDSFKSSFTLLSIRFLSIFSRFKLTRTEVFKTKNDSQIIEKWIDNKRGEVAILSHLHNLTIN